MLLYYCNRSFFYCECVFWIDAYLSTAIKDTFLNRGTVIEDDSFDRIKGLAKNSMILARWDAYKRKMKIALEIEECIGIGAKLLNPVIDSLLNDELMDGRWNAYNQKWI